MRRPRMPLIPKLGIVAFARSLRGREGATVSFALPQPQDSAKGAAD